MANGNFQSSNYAYDLYLYCEWSSKSNTEGNYSDVTITTYLNYYSLYMSAGTNDCSAGVSGVKINQWTGPDIFSGSPGRVRLGSTTVRVPHNTDGSKTCTLSAAYRLNATISGSYIGTMETSASVTLDNIPRASSISSITSSVSMDGNHSVSVGISSASASFNHKIQINLAGTARYISGIVSDRTITYKIPKSWCSYLPNAVSGTATAYLYTYSGSTQIGSPKSATFTVTVPDDVKPTIGGLTAERIDNGVPTAWGLYVRSKSKAKLKMTGTAGSYGSSVQSMSISGGGYSSASSELTTGTLNTAGTNTFTATVTDSRGRKSTGQTSISVVDYSTPAITGYTVNRCLDNGTANDDGTYLSVKAAGTYASCSGKNTMAITVKYRPVGGSWSSETALASGTAKVIGGGEIDVNKSYETDISITDSFGTWHASPPNIPTSFSTIDFRAGGKGVTIGGAAEEDGLVVKIPAKFTNDINIDNNVLNMNAADSGIGFYSSGGGEYPYWRFHANGEMAWIHHWDKDGNIGMPLQFNSDNSIAAINKFFLGDGGLDGSNGLLEIRSSNEASVAYMPNNYDKWVVGANCAGLANCFVWYDSSNGGTRAYIDRNGNFLTAGSIQCGSGGYVLPANANETQKIMFERPSNYEYAARIDVIRNSLRLYTYDRSGTYNNPLNVELDGGNLALSGNVYLNGKSRVCASGKENFKIARGSVAANFVANTQLNLSISFPSGLFSSAPAVFVIAESGSPTSFHYNFTAKDVSTSGATLCLYRGDPTATGMKWIAIGV